MGKQQAGCQFHFQNDGILVFQIAVTISNPLGKGLLQLFGYGAVFFFPKGSQIDGFPLCRKPVACDGNGWVILHGLTVHKESCTFPRIFPASFAGNLWECAALGRTIFAAGYWNRCVAGKPGNKKSPQFKNEELEGCVSQ